MAVLNRYMYEFEGCLVMAICKGMRRKSTILVHKVGSVFYSTEFISSST